MMEQLEAHLKPYLAFSKSAMTHTEWTAHCYATQTDPQEAPTQTQLLNDDGVLNAIVISRGKGFVEYWQKGQSPMPHRPEHVIPFARVDFETARARVEATTIGAYLPQDLDYDLNETVSFTKGCYTGQEIVARLHYRGTPKRRLYRAITSDNPERLAPGEGITSVEERRVGSVVNVLALGEQRGLLVEIMPETATGPLFIREKDLVLSSLEPCHSVADQSMG